MTALDSALDRLLDSLTTAQLFALAILLYVIAWAGWDAIRYAVRCAASRLYSVHAARGVRPSDGIPVPALTDPSPDTPGAGAAAVADLRHERPRLNASVSISDFRRSAR